MLIFQNKRPTTHYGPQYNIEELGPLSSGEERGFRGGRVLRLVPAEEALALFLVPFHSGSGSGGHERVEWAGGSLCHPRDRNQTGTSPSFRFLCRSNCAIRRFATRVPGASLPGNSRKLQAFCGVSSLSFTLRCKRNRLEVRAPGENSRQLIVRDRVRGLTGLVSDPDAD